MFSCVIHAIADVAVKCCHGSAPDASWWRVSDVEAINHDVQKSSVSVIDAAVALATMK